MRFDLYRAFPASHSVLSRFSLPLLVTGFQIVGLASFVIVLLPSNVKCMNSKNSPKELRGEYSGSPVTAEHPLGPPQMFLAVLNGVCIVLYFSGSIFRGRRYQSRVVHRHRPSADASSVFALRALFFRILINFASPGQLHERFRLLNCEDNLCVLFSIAIYKAGEKNQRGTARFRSVVPKNVFFRFL